MLYKNINLTLKCLKFVKKMKNKKVCFKYQILLPSYSKIPYKEIYNKYRGGYTAIVQPLHENNIKIIVGIPFAPPLIEGRIVARRTYMKYRKIDGYKAKYIFFTGLIPDRIYLYNISILIEEAKLFDDIIIFNMINTYYNITLLLLSMYKWIIDNYPKIKYFIRCNLDTLFIPSRIKKLLHNGYDVISQITYAKYRKIIYPQGNFYIFSNKMIYTVYQNSFKMKLHRADDLFYGEIITKNKSIKSYDISDISNYNCTFCKLLYSKRFIALHGYSYSPAIIEIFYNFTLKDNTNT